MNAPIPTREDLAFSYIEQLPFVPYQFQEDAVYAWFSSEQGLLVCAPTGMGKTLIAEAGLYEALKYGKRAYYTTPLIALTEQKFREIQDAAERWGFSREDVGLVTGNRRENPEAKILVVVAEILFNRLLSSHRFESSKTGVYYPNEQIEETTRLSFDDVAVVVMDEFHNFADYERGIVWEFTLGLLPSHIRTLLISATVGNAYEFVSWIRNTTGRKLQMIESTERKVPLTYNWVGDELLCEQLEKMHSAGFDDDEARLTPALVFCFNRDDCWNVADQVRGRNVIDSERQKKLSKILEDYDWTQGAGPKLKQLLLRGVAVHHAGILPKYRRIIETLFQQKLLTICACTETLAAGINLPARSVVLPSLLKGPFGDMRIVDSSTAHQIFGRAGRPQFDTQGFVFSLAHEDDVKIARFRVKYDQIPEDTKDPKLREMKKKLKKKMPTRRATEQYWSEQQFIKLKDSPPGKLASRGPLPWRLLAHIIELDSDITPIREMIGRRLMGVKRLHEGQKELENMLLTLWHAGFVQLHPEPPKKPTGPEDSPNTITVASPNQDEPKYAPELVYPNPSFPMLLKFRGINPLYGVFLLNQLGLADRAERLQGFESVLELPSSIGKFVRVPRYEELPPGKLATERLDAQLLEFGLASVEELVPRTEEEEWEEREKRRHFGGESEERVFVLKFAEKLQRLFEHEFPGVAMRTNAVWAAGEILLEFRGDFNKYVTSNGIQKQEGIIFRHLLRLILLLEEFAVLSPTEGDPAEWQADLRELGEMLIACCRKVDPGSTEETLEFARNRIKEQDF